MKERIVVIGGGHNGLVAAGLLAKAGRPVVLVEARQTLGGLAGATPIADGYRAPGILQTTSGLRPSIVQALELEKHGLSFREAPEVAAVHSNGATLRLGRDRVVGAEAADTSKYSELRGFLARVGRVLAKVLDGPPPSPRGPLFPLARHALAVRRLGPADLLELLRVAPMCVADWMRDNFKSDHLSAAVCSPALLAAWAGPWSAHTASSLLVREALENGREVAGGPAAVISALEKAARTHGAEIRTGAPVDRIVVQRAGATGVTLAGGETIEAGTILATTDPRTTFLKLVGRRNLPEQIIHDVERIRLRGTTAAVQLALSGPLELRDGTAVEALRTGDGLNEVERAFDPIKYRRASERPVLEVRVPSIGDAALAPKGHHVVSILAQYAPYHLEGGWTDARRDAFGDAVVEALEGACPTLRERLVAKRVLTPLDLEVEYGLSAGHLFHGEHAPDQLLFLRPTLHTAEYATPIPGLFVGGSGSHPGGGLTGGPGALAARAVLRHKAPSHA